MPEPADTQAAAGKRRRFTVDALFTDHRPQAVGVADLAGAKEIRLDRIEPDPDQPRRSFDDERLGELADSIRREGVLQPIAVRYEADRDVYVVLHGERRWRASRLAGLATIPAVVRDVPAERRLLQQLMENVVRDDLNAVDRAAALRALNAQLGDAPWDDVAAAVGIGRSRLFQLLGTEKLPETARDDIRSGRISEKQSRALHGLDPARQDALRSAIVADDLPAEEAQRLAKALRARPAPAEAEQAVAELRQLRREVDRARPAAPRPERAAGDRATVADPVAGQIRSLIAALRAAGPATLGSAPVAGALADLRAVIASLPAPTDPERGPR